MPDDGVRCMICKTPITRRELRRCDFEVTGFERLRNAGGANQIIDRERTNRVRCWQCSQKPPAQKTLI